jgi:aconitate hydratase
MITHNSALGTLLASGVRLQENACGFCIGAGQSPQTGGISVRTNNRNFFGRSGTKNAQVYLVSPETAAASALTGVITDPRDLGIPYPRMEIFPQVIPDKSLFIFPPKTSEKVEIYRGPHMDYIPLNSYLPDAIAGEVTIKLGDNVTTDHICPSGSRMIYRSNIRKYAEFVLEAVDPQFKDHAMRIKKQGMSNIIVAGISYGQGSSREHAALCPMYLGVKIVVAKSFERIHKANLINFGIIPFTFADDTDYAWINQGDKLEVHALQHVLKCSDKVNIVDETKDEEFEVLIRLSERERRIILAGGALPYIKRSLIRN